MIFPRQKYWSGWPFPSPGDLFNPRIKPMSPVSLALQSDSLPAEPSGSLLYSKYNYYSGSCYIPNLGPLSLPCFLMAFWNSSGEKCSGSWFILLGSRRLFYNTCQKSFNYASSSLYNSSGKAIFFKGHSGTSFLRSISLKLIWSSITYSPSKNYFHEFSLRVF